MRNPFCPEASVNARSRTEMTHLVSGPSAARIMRQMSRNGVSALKLVSGIGFRLNERESVQEFLLQEREALRSKEQKILSEFFEKEVDVPPLPEVITHERMQEWEKMGLELHYLPCETMGEILFQNGLPSSHLVDLSDWRKRPSYFNLDISRIQQRSLQLLGGWILIDARSRPMYQKGAQMYEHDFLAPVLAQLRASGLLPSYEIPESRFNLRAEEILSSRVLGPIAEVYEVNPESLDFLYEIEFNILGNIHYPEWGNADCDEFFADTYQGGGGHFIGGASNKGGLSYIWPLKYGSGNSRIGFRLIVRF